MRVRNFLKTRKKNQKVSVQKLPEKKKYQEKICVISDIKPSPRGATNLGLGGSFLRRNVEIRRLTRGGSHGVHERRITLPTPAGKKIFQKHLLFRRSFSDNLGPVSVRPDFMNCHCLRLLNV